MNDLSGIGKFLEPTCPECCAKTFSVSKGLVLRFWNLRILFSPQCKRIGMEASFPDERKIGKVKFK